MTMLKAICIGAWLLGISVWGSWVTHDMSRRAKMISALALIWTPILVMEVTSSCG